ncbi:phosphoribosyl-ATP pyrophosphohydrolase [Arthrobacter sp. GAS37]|uniref:phosphoribosyl-ATP pyrophosphohydrolase n=1 Tax=Arthrobacter sp. GAS37 TaxID=3156261 RepID=UPI003850938D
MGKLVRDRIPEVVARDGGQIPTRVLDDSEFGRALRDKVREEALEVAQAASREALIEELADLREVAGALARHEGIDEDVVRARADEKRITHGAFDARLLSTSCCASPEASPAAH